MLTRSADDLRGGPEAVLTSVPLLAGLDQAALADILACARTRRYAQDALICQEGDPSDRVLVLQRGVAEAFVTSVTESRAISVGCLRPGDIIGEVGVVTHGPRSASVLTRTEALALEIGRDDFETLLARHPRLQSNLMQVLGERLAKANAALVDRRTGEIVMLIVGRDRSRAAADVIAAARRASPRPLAAVDLVAPRRSDGEVGTPLPDVVPHSMSETIEQLDGLAAIHPTVALVVRCDDPGLARLVEHADRVLALVAPEEVAALTPVLDATSHVADLILCSGTAEPALPPGESRVVRRCGAELTRRDVAWLGRHLSRSKLGLALGAGGAKCFAHAGVVQVLERAGYEIDYVAGSSMGAVVGIWLALGMTGAEIAATLRDRCAPDAVADAIFRKGAGGGGPGVFTRIFRETTANRTFADLTIPAVVMTADLESRRPAPLTEGPLWKALLAALSIPGLYPPYVRGAQRLVDAVSLIPVPVDTVAEAGQT